MSLCRVLYDLNFPKQIRELLQRWLNLLGMVDTRGGHELRHQLYIRLPSVVLHELRDMEVVSREERLVQDFAEPLTPL